MKIDLTAERPLRPAPQGFGTGRTLWPDFSGVSKGWLAKSEIPKAESLAGHISQIDDITEFDQVVSGLGEMDNVIAQLDRGLCGSRIS